MKMYNRICKPLFLSILSALTFGSIALTTSYALFSNTSKSDVTVSTGKVNVVLNTSDLKTYSGVNLSGDPDKDVIKETETVGTFSNGGTALLEGTSIVLNNITLGDKATFKIIVKNESSIPIKYRTKVVVTDDTGLYAGLNVKIGTYTNTLCTGWAYLALGSADEKYDCEVFLPSNAGKGYQGKNCKISFSVEAVQGNAYTDDENSDMQVIDTITRKSYSSLSDAILAEDASGEYKLLKDTIYETDKDYFNKGNVVIDLNGKTLTSKSTFQVISGLESLTFKDSSNTNSGVIRHHPNPYDPPFIEVHSGATSNGKLPVVTIEENIHVSTWSPYAIVISNSVKYLDNGVLKEDTTSPVKVELNMKGSLYCWDDSTNFDGIRVDGNQKGNKPIEDIIINISNNIDAFEMGIEMYSGTLNVTKGTIEGATGLKAAVYEEDKDITDVININLTGGTFVSTYEYSVYIADSEAITFTDTSDVVYKGNKVIKGQSS